VAANCEKIAKLFVAKVITKMPFSQHPKKNSIKEKKTYCLTKREKNHEKGLII